MKHTVATLAEAEEMIKQRLPFRLKGGGSLSAVTEAPTYVGHLPDQFREAARSAGYVVLSYATPIAWVTDGEATVPDVGYSLTTGQHQYLAAHALGVEFRPKRGRPVVPSGTGRDWT